MLVRYSPASSAVWLVYPVSPHWGKNWVLDCVFNFSILWLEITQQLKEYYFCRGPKLNSQHPCWLTHSRLLVPGYIFCVRVRQTQDHQGCNHVGRRKNILCYQGTEAMEPKGLDFISNLVVVGVQFTRVHGRNRVTLGWFLAFAGPRGVSLWRTDRL